MNQMGGIGDLEGSLKKEGMNVYIWQIHDIEQHKLTHIVEQLYSNKHIKRPTFLKMKIEIYGYVAFHLIYNPCYFV